MKQIICREEEPSSELSLLFWTQIEVNNHLEAETWTYTSSTLENVFRHDSIRRRSPGPRCLHPSRASDRTERRLD